MPVNETVSISKGIDVWANFGTEYFLERREIGIFNIGGAGKIKADGEVSKTAEPSKEVSKVDENKSGSAAGENKGFPADATIGVSLPWLGTQNWKEADVMFKEELEKAGFKVILQAADNKVAQQQQQIESMIQNGAKVIVVGPIDGSQLGTVLEEAEAAGVSVIGYDRLIEMCSPVRFTGSNFRKATAQEKMGQLKKLMNRKESRL